MNVSNRGKIVRNCLCRLCSVPDSECLMDSLRDSVVPGTHLLILICTLIAGVRLYIGRPPHILGRFVALDGLLCDDHVHYVCAWHLKHGIQQDLLLKVNQLCIILSVSKFKNSIKQ